MAPRAHLDPGPNIFAHTLDVETLLGATLAIATDVGATVSTIVHVSIVDVPPPILHPCPRLTVDGETGGFRCRYAVNSPRRRGVHSFW